ncbi:DUF3455 domain-containing protein [Dactylosporangium vinaceum]|uniref:DUF3455 domain-containing protein n=1 Tax=Dactylosporangium vinaceum TaxID=53362 RepID=A0ABV5M5H9_9ACTN|nr:DUF3455 domain-containing protein [Dactylosporangium vinaceum]UAB95561.1 DUF3455 domain-containing protein [Dactylosporangium vinaceum]
MATAVLAAAALAAVGTGTASAATATDAATTIDATSGSHFRLPAGAPTPGEGYRIGAAYRVTTGTQTYACTTNTDGTTTWATKSTPEATLQRYGRPPTTIHHYAGPRWESNRDHSIVVGAVDQTVPKTGTIAWLLLHVAAHENTTPGELNRVQFISRVNTTGGVGPTGPCTPGTDTPVSVPYTADYVFWISCKPVARALD